MQQKKYYQWVSIAVGAIVVVVLLFVFILKDQKDQGQTPSNTTPTPSATPISNASDLPTTVPTASPTTSPSATPASTASHKTLAQEAYKNKQYTVAISEYLQAIDATKSTGELAELWNELGNTYRDNQNSAEALKAYDKSLSFNNKLGDTYLNKAALQWTMTQKDAARATLKVGIDANASRKSDLQNTLSVYEVDQ